MTKLVHQTDTKKCARKPLVGSKLAQSQRVRAIALFTDAVAVQRLAQLHLSCVQALVGSFLPQRKRLGADAAITDAQKKAESVLTVSAALLRARARQI